MADGSPIENAAITGGNFHTSWIGTDAATGTTNGVWIDIRGWRSMSVHCIGGTGTIQVRASNSPTKPDNTIHDAQLGPDIILSNTQAVLSIDEPLRWMKTMVSAYTAGALSTYINAVL